jgi:divalent metal cation (Fe/Co/Zn/Cd) transporter
MSLIDRYKRKEKKTTTENAVRLSSLHTNTDILFLLLFLFTMF